MSSPLKHFVYEIPQIAEILINVSFYNAAVLIWKETSMLEDNTLFYKNNERWYLKYQKG